MPYQKKKIIILGAGFEQQTLYKLCKKEKLFTIAVDKNLDFLKQIEANFKIHCSIHDYNRIIETLKQKYKNIIGVLAVGVEATKTVYELEKFFKIGIISKRSTILGSNKQLLYKALYKDINIPQYGINYNLVSLLKFIKKNGYPLIIKPANLSGSRGVLCINNRFNLNQNLKNKKINFGKNIILQKHISGDQISAEALIIGDKIINIITDRDYSSNSIFRPHIIERGGSWPSKISKQNKLKIDELLIRIAKKFKIKLGPLKCDLIVKKNKIFLIEATPRFGGGRVSTDICKKIATHSLVEIFLKYLTNKKIKIINFSFKNIYFVNKFFISYKSQKLKKINKTILKKFKKNIIFSYLKKDGDIVKKPESHSDRVGMISCFHKNKHTCKSIVHKVVTSIEKQINN